MISFFPGTFLMFTCLFQLHCCGRTGPLDWAGLTLPASCCKDPALQTCTAFEAYSTGCESALQDFVRKNVDIIGYVGIGIVVVEVSPSIYLILEIILYISEFKIVWIKMKFLTNSLQTLLISIFVFYPDRRLHLRLLFSQPHSQPQEKSSLLDV